MRWSIANGALLQLLFYLWTVYYIPDTFGLKYVLFSFIILAQMSENKPLAWPRDASGHYCSFIAARQQLADDLLHRTSSTSKSGDLYRIAQQFLLSTEQAHVTRALIEMFLAQKLIAPDLPTIRQLLSSFSSQSTSPTTNPVVQYFDEYLAVQTRVQALLERNAQLAQSADETTLIIQRENTAMVSHFEARLATLAALIRTTASPSLPRSSDASPSNSRSSLGAASQASSAASPDVQSRHSSSSLRAITDMFISPLATRRAEMVVPSPGGLAPVQELSESSSLSPAAVENFPVDSAGQAITLDTLLKRSPLSFENNASEIHVYNQCVTDIALANPHARITPISLAIFSPTVQTPLIVPVSEKAADQIRSAFAKFGEFMEKFFLLTMSIKIYATYCDSVQLSCRAHTELCPRGPYLWIVLACLEEPDRDLDRTIWLVRVIRETCSIGSSHLGLSNVHAYLATIGRILTDWRYKRGDLPENFLGQLLIPLVLYAFQKNGNSQLQQFVLEYRRDFGPTYSRTALLSSSYDLSRMTLTPAKAQFYSTQTLFDKMHIFFGSLAVSTDLFLQIAPEVPQQQLEVMVARPSFRSRGSPVHSGRSDPLTSQFESSPKPATGKFQSQSKFVPSKSTLPGDLRGHIPRNRDNICWFCEVLEVNARYYYPQAASPLTNAKDVAPSRKIHDIKACPFFQRAVFGLSEHFLNPTKKVAFASQISADPDGFEWDSDDVVSFQADDGCVARSGAGENLDEGEDF